MNIDENGIKVLTDEFLFQTLSLMHVEKFLKLILENITMAYGNENYDRGRGALAHKKLI